MNLRVCCVALSAGVLLTPVVCAAAVKTDVVELLNGDRVTCEIRKLERGKLTVKTDGIGTISIEWDDITRVTSLATYDVELESGARYFGSLSPSRDPRTLTVVTAAGPERFDMFTVIRISPLSGKFWRRLDGSIDAGFSFAQANVQTQWTFDTTVSYRGRRWVSTLDADSALTLSEDADRQTRNSLSLASERLLVRRWSVLAFAQFQQNEELTLNLRAVLGTAMKRVLSQTNRHVVSLTGGVAFTREEYEGDDDDGAAEAVGAFMWNWFTFDGRSTNLSVSATSFFALTRHSRVRLELDTTFRSDIVGDLYWSVNTFESYTSEPPGEEKSNDFGISAAIGWSF